MTDQEKQVIMKEISRLTTLIYDNRLNIYFTNVLKKSTTNLERLFNGEIYE